MRFRLEGCLVSARNPLSQRCTATCKATKARCRKWVIAGGPNAVCDSHGGRAAQVRRAKAVRLATMQAELEAAQKGQVFERRHPLEVLWDALLGSDVLLQVLLRKQAAGELTADESLALGLAIDRATRTSKTAIDANLEQRWVEAQEVVARSQADRLIRAMDRLLADERVIIVGDAREIVLDAVRELGPVEPAEPLAISR